MGLFAFGAGACSAPLPSQDGELSALISRIGAEEFGARPEEAQVIGLSRETFGGDYGGLLNDRSMAVTERGRTNRLADLRALEGFDPNRLTTDARRMHASALWLYQAVTEAEAHGYGYVDLGRASPYLINFADGAYTDLPKFLTLHSPVQSRAAAQDWLKRLAAMDDAMRDERRRFEVDIEADGPPPASVLRRTLSKARDLAPVNAREHPLVMYFVESLAQIPDIPEDEIAALVKRAADLVGGDIKAEYGRLIALLEKTLSTAPDDPGVWRMRNGEAYYANALRLGTTTDMSALQLHQAGEKLVASLSAEIEPMLAELGLAEGSIGGRLQALAMRPEYLLPDTPEGRVALLGLVNERMAWAEKASATILPASPKTKVEVREAPRLAQDTAPRAYYKAGSLDGGRPGVYNINLRSTLDFPTWTLPTLSYHEAAPGHHIQAGLARERAGQPALHYLVSLPAFSEGWATYGEDLADQLGAYKEDRLGRLGYLQSLLVRAARLVVDTGIHAQRWDRAQAVDYLETNAGIGRDEAEMEVDRYSVWPGMAPAYMAGRETIRRLRATAERDLKSRFNIKAFHAAILEPGPRPLPVVEADIADWIESQRPKPPPE